MRVGIDRGQRSRADSIRSRRIGGAPARLAIAILVLAGLAACSGSSPVASAGKTESPETVQKNCADPHWRDQNLGLWYSVCRPAFRW
jgi:hypothetical protein